MMPPSPAIVHPARDVLGGQAPDRDDRQHDERADEHDVDEGRPGCSRARPLSATSPMAKPYASLHLGQPRRRVQPARGRVLLLRAQRHRLAHPRVAPTRATSATQRPAEPAAPRCGRHAEPPERRRAPAHGGQSIADELAFERPRRPSSRSVANSSRELGGAVAPEVVEALGVERDERARGPPRGPARSGTPSGGSARGTPRGWPWIGDDALADAHPCSAVRAEQRRPAAAARARAPSPRSRASARASATKRRTWRGEHQTPRIASTSRCSRQTPSTAASPRSVTRMRHGAAVAVRRELLGGVEEALGADRGPELRAPRASVAWRGARDLIARTAHERADREPGAGRRAAAPRSRCRTVRSAEPSVSREPSIAPGMTPTASTAAMRQSMLPSSACVIVPGIARMVMASKRGGDGALDVEAEPAREHRDEDEAAAEPQESGVEAGEGADRARACSVGRLAPRSVTGFARSLRGVGSDSAPSLSAVASLRAPAPASASKASASSAASRPSRGGRSDLEDHVGGGVEDQGGGGEQHDVAAHEAGRPRAERPRSPSPRGRR